MFRSSGPAVFAFQDPNARPAAATYVNDPDHEFVSIVDPVGTILVNNVALTALAAPFSFVRPVTYMNGYPHPVQIIMDVGALTVAGTYVCILNTDLSDYVSQVDSCQWGGTVDLLCQGAENVTAGGAVYQNTCIDTPSDISKLKYAAYGNCAWDPVAKTITFQNGETFRLIDVNGDPCDQDVAVARDNSSL